MSEIWAIPRIAVPRFADGGDRPGNMAEILPMATQYGGKNGARSARIRKAINTTPNSRQIQRLFADQFRYSICHSILTNAPLRLRL